MDLPENIDDILPLSPVQSGMLLHSIGNEAGHGTYVGVVSSVIEGALDPSRFQRAFKTAVQAHDTLRASFIYKGTKKPVQVIHKTYDFPWYCDDWSSLTDMEVERRKKALLEKERGCGFDLSSPPLMRVHLNRLADDRHLFVWCLHHILSDGWSTTVFLDHVLRLYETEDEKWEQIAKPKSSFKDYLRWLKRRDTAEAKTYWSKHMSGFQGPTVIASRRPETTSSPLHQICSRRISVAQTGAMDEAARHLRVTQSSFLATVWALTLRRYSGSNDITFGMTSAGRPAELPGLAQTVGPFLNTLPLRISTNASVTFKHLTSTLELTMRERAAHEFVSLKDVRDWCGASPDQQLFDALFVHESIPEIDASSGALRFSDMEILGPSNYALALVATPVNGYSLDLYYDPSVFPVDVIENMLSDFITLLGNAVKDHARPISHLLAPEFEATTIVNTPAETFPSVVAAFREIADRDPTALAVSDFKETLTYGALRERIDRTVGLLKDAGLGRGDIVPVAADRSVEAIVAYFSVMALGAAYAPIDPEYPDERLRTVLESIAARTVLATRSLQGKLPRGAWRFLYTDSECPPAPKVELPDPALDSAAYVLFTSGSQGVPKGVIISHGALAHSTFVRQDVYAERPACFLLLSSFAFDSSIAGIFWTLCLGGHLVIAPRRLENDPKALGMLLATKKVTHTLCLPRLYHELLGAVTKENLSSLKTVIIAGEAVDTDLVTRHRNAIPGCRLFNEYGPTEATVWATVFDTSDHTCSGSVPIGMAIPGVEVVVRDIDGFSLPPNVQGNITISGPTLASGYLSNAQETDRKFRLLPDGPGMAKRAYLTGDLGTYTAVGLMFAGRADQQIKVRGHRVELGEIETIVHETIGPVSCCALLAEAKGTSRLMLCIEGLQNRECEELLMSRFEQRLPSYARPREIRWRTHIRKLPNGKLDRSTLALDVGAEVNTERGISEPSTLTEKRLAKIWAEVLNLRAVPRDANFFDLGGDSLKTISLYALAEQEGFNLSPNDIFEHPTVAGLAEYITTSSLADVSHHDESAIRKVHVDGSQSPVILVHANMYVLNHLARALGNDHPVGLKFTHLYNGMTLPIGTTIESLAKDTILEFGDFLQKGPCILVGYSAGCLIAQQMAHEITKQGGKVALLCYLDPPFSLIRHGKEHRFVGNRISRYARMGFLLARNAFGTAWHTVGGSHEAIRRLKVNTATALAVARFEPVPFDGQIFCITSLDEPNELSRISNAETEHIAASHLGLLKDRDTAHFVAARLVARVRKISKELGC